MKTYMLKCKNCGGLICEEETFIDDNDVKIMQLGCYICSHKAYIKFSNWKKFKKKLSEAVKSNV